jgi:hypothetical protein
MVRKALILLAASASSGRWWPPQRPTRRRAEDLEAAGASRAIERQNAESQHCAGRRALGVSRAAAHRVRSVFFRKSYSWFENADASMAPFFFGI